MEVVARGETAVGAGAGAAEVLCAVFAEPPGLCELLALRLWRGRSLGHDVAARGSQIGRRCVRAGDFQADAPAATKDRQVLLLLLLLRRAVRFLLHRIVFPTGFQFLAHIVIFLPSNQIRDPIPQPPVPRILDKNMLIQPRDLPTTTITTTLNQSRADFPDLVLVLQVDMGAAVAAEEAGEVLGRFVFLNGSLDVDVGAFGEGGDGDAEEAGLVAAGPAVAED